MSVRLLLAPGVWESVVLFPLLLAPTPQPHVLRCRCIMGLLLLVVLAIVALIVLKVTGVEDTLPGVS